MSARFTVEFDTDNDAFEGLDGPEEVARILRRIAARVLHGDDSGKAMDSNGNTVGRWQWGMP